MKSSRFSGLMLSLVLLAAVFSGSLFAAGSNLTPVDEITIYCPGDPPAKSDQVFDELNKRVKQELNINKISIIFIPWGDLASKTTVKLTAGDTGDLFFDAPWLHMNQMIAKDMYLPLDELLAKYGQGILKSVPTKMMQYNKFQGKIYGIPIGFCNLGSGIAYRADLAKKYQVGPVNSWTSLEKYLAVIKAKDPSLLGISFNNDTSVFDELYIKSLSRMPLGNNGCIAFELNNTGKVVPFYHLPDYQNKLKMLQRWYQKGYIDQDILSQKDWKALWNAGRIAVTRSDAGVATDTQLKEAVRSGAVGEWIPYFEKQKPLTDFKQWNFQCLNRKSKNPERAMMFLNWIYSSQANYDLIVHGIKGQDWIDAGKNLYKLPEGYNPATGYTFPWYILCGNPSQIRLDAGMNAEDMKLTQMAMDEKNYTPSILSGFTFDPEPVKAEVAKCTALYTTKMIPLWDGVTADTAGVTKAYKDAGYDKVVVEMQKQVNAYLAKKKK